MRRRRHTRRHGGAGDVWWARLRGVRSFVGVTDEDWYRFLAASPELTEANFWRPSGNHAFRALTPGGDCQKIGSGSQKVVWAGQLSKIRCRSSGKPARPYICRFRSLNLVLVPSIGPLL
jgi:hypothetical protein